MLVAITGGTVGGVLGGLLGGSGEWIKGTWVSNYGSYITITDDYWISVSPWGTSVHAIDQLTPGYVIMQNPSSDDYNPDKWTKNEFHRTEGDDWGYCSSVYNAATAQAAVDTDTSSIYTAADAEKGCNGFGHTKLSPYALPIIGGWNDNFGAKLTINATHWASEASWGSSVYRILAWGNDFVLMQNPSDDTYNPSKWTYVQFHSVAGGGIGFCMSVYDGADQAATLATDTTNIYAAANSTHGCNNFPHTIATPA
jgi:hypothetical protein